MGEIENIAGIPWWGAEISRRLKKIEDLEPAVLAKEVALLADDVRALKRAWYTFAFAVVTSSIIFAFSVFALLGRH